MSEYIIRADDGYNAVPVSDIGQSTINFDTVTFTSEDIVAGGTTTDPVKLWEGNGGYIRAYGSGNNVNLQVHSMNGTIDPWGGVIGPVNETDKIFICGITRTILDVQHIYCYYTYAANEEEARERLNRTAGTTSLLYSNTVENSEDILSVETPWDETPTEDVTDPNNEKPEGGEHADRGNFADNDLMLLEDMPNPELNEMNYGSLMTCYAMRRQELDALAAALFRPTFWQSMKSKFEGLSDPMAFILDAVELPLPVTDFGISRIILGGTKLEDENGNWLTSAYYSTRFKKYNMGSLSLKEIWGSEKDYSNTTISIYLPYCGVKELDPDIVLNCTVTLMLYVDRWNGDILYLLHASNNAAAQKYYRQENVVYRWSGNCGRRIPLGRVDNSNQIIQAVSGLAGIAAGYGMGGVGGAVMGAIPTIQNIAAGNFKPTVQTSGGVSGNVGRMDYQYAYLIIKRGVPEYPNGWRSEIGAPRYQELLISSLSGYTLFSTVYLENIECMAEEKEELEKLLTTEGVIL